MWRSTQAMIPSCSPISEHHTDTKQPFAYTDACVVHGVHTGYDPVATQEAKQAVKEFFNFIFYLIDDGDWWWWWWGCQFRSVRE